MIYPSWETTITIFHFPSLSCHLLYLPLLYWVWSSCLALSVSLHHSMVRTGKGTSIRAWAVFSHGHSQGISCYICEPQKLWNLVLNCNVCCPIPPMFEFNCCFSCNSFQLIKNQIILMLLKTKRGKNAWNTRRQIFLSRYPERNPELHKKPFQAMTSNLFPVWLSIFGLWDNMKCPWNIAAYKQALMLQARSI